MLKQKVRSKLLGLNLFLGFTLALLVFNGWFLNDNFKSLSDEEFWVNHTYQVISELDLLLSSVKDAETGVRGYILTKDSQYLQPYQTGTVETWDHFNKAKFLTLDNPTQQDNSIVLSDIIKKRLLLLENIVKIKTPTNNFGTKDLAYSEGKSVMDSLREQIAKMKSGENVLLERRLKDAEQSKIYFFWSLILTSFLSIAVIIAGFLQIRRSQLRTLKEIDTAAYEEWLKTHVSDMAQALTGNIDSEAAAEFVLNFFVDKFKILAANFYVVRGDRFKKLATTGTTTSDIAPDFMGIDEGLVGEALKFKTWREIENIPEGYLDITSSLGKSAPKSLIFLPIYFQDTPIAVVELAHFHPFPQNFKDLITRLGEPVGIAMNSVLYREDLKILLTKTQRQTEELQAQTEELQAQQEELQAQQEELTSNNEELEQQARALESQQQNLNTKNLELETSKEQIEAKAYDLERASQYKSEFLAKMSHELRTPLNSLLILATLLIENKEKNLTGQQKEFATSIRNAGNDLLHLITDILDLSKIEARKLNIRPESFTLEQLLSQLKMTFEHETKAKNLKFVVDFIDTDPQTVMFTDRQRVEQILRNFLSNSIKFTEKGKISLTAKQNSDGTIELSVQDTGIGISKDKQESIFEAFEQADSSISRKYGGTGLGLTISRELAMLLKGEIRLTSTEGQGSQFVLNIPQKLDAIAAITDFPKTKMESDDEKFTPEMFSRDINSQNSEDAIKALSKIKKEDRTILIVEDDPVFRKSMAEAVRGYGFTPIETSNGLTAWHVLESHVPTSILLDIKLPGISGLGLLEMIKQLPHLRHVPIHIISALEYKQNALRLGAIGYLGKPVSIDKIRSALAHIEQLALRTARKLLIIEDDMIQRQAISELISGPDVEIDTTDSAKSAIKKIKNNNYDCIILDLSLKDESGFEFLDQLNTLDVSLPPIVIYTGKDLTREEEEHLRKYSESIIIKGAKSPERLLDEVNLFLHRMETLLPQDKREMLTQLRSQEKSFENKTALVVDDDLRNIFALTSALETKGLNVCIARDGIEALEVLDKKSHLIDIVLMDIMMPRLDGFETMKRMRANEKFKHLPVVALTAKAMKNDHERCMEAGANDYLPKPVDLVNLFSVLKVWLAPKGVFK